MSDATISLLIGGALAVIAGFATAAVKVIAAINATKATAVATKDVVENRATSQDHELKEIKLLVDGRYGEVLQELADMKKLLAAETGRKADAQQAASAQKRADEQQARVAAAAEGKPK